MSAGPSPPERAGAGRRRLRRVVGLLTILVAVSTVAWGRCTIASETTGRSLQRGADALAEAVATGDEAAWQRAVEAHQRATGDSLLDAYPLFALDLVERLRAEEPGDVGEAVRRYLRAIERDAPDEARDAIDEVEQPRARRWLRRFLEAFEAARRRRAEE